MKKSSILSALCTLFLVSFVSGCFITNHVKNSIKGSTKTKGYVVKKVKTPDMIPPSASADDGTGWKLIDFDEGFVKKYGPKGIRIFVVVYFFREFDSFTCRVYRAKSGKPGGDPVSLPEKALGVGFHKFSVRTRKAGNVKLECREDDSMPLTLSELKAEQK